MVPLIFTGAICVTSLPILHSIKWGQVSIWLTIFLCMALFPNGVAVSRAIPSQVDTDRFGNNRTAWLLGLAASIKIYPIVFLLLPLLRNRLVWVLHCVFALVLLGVVLPWLWLGDEVWHYLYAVQRGQQVVSNMGSTAGGQALSPALHRWFVSGEFIGASTSGTWSIDAVLVSASWAKVTVMLSTVLALIALVWSLRTKKIDTCVIFTLLIFIHLLLQPGWVHYFCWLPLVHVWCWYQARGKPWALCGLGFALVLERMPLILLNRSNYFAFSRAGWMTVVLLLTLIVLLYLLSTDDGYPTEVDTN